jgi:2-oxoglutarate ferredoxin oxidoreductase subunit alpha
MKAKRSLTIMIGGPAGSGIKSVEKLLVATFRHLGFALFSSKEYMSRVRGGTNTVQIRIATTQVAAATWKTDLYCALDTKALEHAAGRFDDNTLLAGEGIGDAGIAIAFKEEATKAGGKQYISTYAAGFILGLLDVDKTIALKMAETLFQARDPEANRAVMQRGLQRGQKLQGETSLRLPASAADNGDCLYLDGTTACGFGFLAGGCNFVASYPMSPSTGVLNFMAEQSKTLTILIEQAEDEIAAFNMVQGAWYGGARALTTTSGGGFALMGEGISLSGMTETPAVVYLAQRPGPATGLPTRSEQGDLNLAIYSGHGDFPRIVLAPGDTDECIRMGHLAFEYADRFQVPVILLIDQYLADAYQATGVVDFNKQFPSERYIQKTEETYRRFALTGDGISPRGIPGFGEGLVCCDSDEHDERGQITESYSVRDTMVAKRHRKEAAVLATSLPPETGQKTQIAVIGWGSSKKVIEEVLDTLDDPRLFQVHFTWVHPLSTDAVDFLRDTDANIVIENNSNAQFAMQLKQHGIPIAGTILQSNGFPFFIDQLTLRLLEMLKELP